MARGWAAFRCRASFNVWLYVAPGSGISVNVGKTLAIHEPHAVASGIFGADKDKANSPTRSPKI